MKKILLILVTIVLSSLCFAQWSTDSTVNNTVDDQSGQQNIHNAALYQHCLATDGAGGVIVVWQDTRSNAAIYTQRVDNNGNLKWDAAGISVATLASNTWNVLNPSITSDGKGGAIMVWQRNASGYFDSLFAQRVDASGNVKWTVNGVSICTNGNTNQYPVVCSDNNGGAIIAWQNDIPYQYTINAQRIDSNGVAQWTTDGVIVRTGGAYHYNPQICSDEKNGAIISWYSDNSNTPVYVQRIDGSGNLKWSPDANPPSSANAIRISGTSNSGSIPRIISDGNGGAIISSQQSSSGIPYIYVQRVDSNGTILWGTGGIEVCSQKSQYANIASDGTGGVVLAWSDYRAGTGWWNIYAQHITSAGSASWTADGIAIQNISKIGSAIYPSITADGNGGVFIAWVDNRSGNNQLYEQSISNSGTVNWLSNGITVSKFSFGTGPSAQQIISGGSNNSILVWEDTRNSGATNLYAQGVSSIGALPVELVSFTASSTKNSVELKWKTATEVNDFGFDVERSALNSMPSAKSIAQSAESLASGTWAKIGFVKGSGNSNSPKQYSFVDNNLTDGNNFDYRLKQIDNNGSFKYSNIVEVTVAPSKFSLYQNYPNPFNPTTTIRYAIPKAEYVTLKVYDELGKEITTLVNENKQAGSYSVQLSEASVQLTSGVSAKGEYASGVYFYRLQAGNFSSVKKLILIK